MLSDLRVESVRITPIVARRGYATVSSTVTGTREKRDSYFLIIELGTNNGLWGIGEISDLDLDPGQKLLSSMALTGKSAEEIGKVEEYNVSTMRADVLERIERAVVGANPFDAKRIRLKYESEWAAELSLGEPLTAKIAWAISMALYDLMGKAVNMPAYSFLGGKLRDKVYISWVAYIRGAEDLRNEIEEKCRQGFNAFKLKVGNDRALNRERVQMVREVAGPDASIKVDAMGSWNVPEAIECIRDLEEFDLLGVETPISFNDAEANAEVRRNTRTRIIEHANCADFAMKLLKADAVDAINVTPTVLTGLDQAHQLISLASGGGVQVLLGSDVELGPGTSAALHIGVSCEGITYPSDLIGPGMYEEDIITEPFTYREGFLEVPEGPGLGVELDAAQLKAMEWIPE